MNIADRLAVQMYESGYQVNTNAGLKANLLLDHIDKLAQLANKN